MVTASARLRWALAAMGALMVMPASPAAAADERDGTLGALRRQAETSAASLGGQSVVRVRPRTAQESEAARRLSISEWGPGLADGTLLLRVHRGAAGEMARSGLIVETVIADVGDAVGRHLSAQADAMELAGGGLAGIDYTAYPTQAEVDAFLDALPAAYPAIASTFEVGLSVENRMIRGVRLSASADAEAPVIIFTGGQHAREWISPITVMYIAERIASGYGSDAELTALLDGAAVMLIPVCNPDGYEYTFQTERLWRKNRTNNGNGTFGIDLNRNWDWAWGGPGSSGDPSSNTYRGVAPFSEPETDAIRQLFESTATLAAHIDFHSWGQLIISPWNHTTAPTAEPYASWFDDTGRVLRQEMLDAGGEVYSAGTGGAQLYLFSGSMPDWVFGALGVPSYTIELRPDSADPGFLLPPAEILPTASEAWAATRRYMTLALQPATPSLGSVTVAEGIPAGDGTVTLSYTLTPNPFNDGATERVDLLHRVAGETTFSSTPLVAADGAWHATIAAPPCGETLEFFARATGAGGLTSSDPASAEGGPDLFFRDPIVVAVSDDAESDAGWTVGAPGDSAYLGRWELADPQPTPAQPGSDTTPGGGTRCWVTDGRSGSVTSSFDIDGGATTLTSPIMDATPPAGRSVDDLTISFDVWYSNDLTGSADDELLVLISGDGGATWATLDAIGATTDGWERRAYGASGLIGDPAAVRLRFVASDTGNISVVEAAIDELRLSYDACPSGCGLDRVAPLGVVDGADVIDFVSAADSDEPGTDLAPPFASTDAFDVFALMGRIAGGCP